MFAFIRGEIAELRTDAVVIDAGGVGWLINTSVRGLAGFGHRGEQATAYTTQVVRETEQTLYGFPTQAENQMFNLLLGVTGVGPKVALSIMSSLSTDGFALAVLNRDIKTLMTAKGLGKKGAERLILELRDKLEGAGFSPDEGLADGTAAPAAGGQRAEVVSALLVLGYSSSEAEDLTRRSFDPEADIQGNIRAALKLAVH